MGKVQQISMVTLAEVEARANAEYWSLFGSEIRELASTIQSHQLPEHPRASSEPFCGTEATPCSGFSNSDDQALYFSDDYRASHPFAADGRPTCPSKQGKWQPPFPER